MFPIRVEGISGFVRVCCHCLGGECSPCCLAHPIHFIGPRFKEDGRLKTPARMTVEHNGHVIHDDVPLTGPSSHHKRPPYKVMPEKVPFMLQDHGNPVMYRNIWVLEKPAR
jgi:hypothetical protein